MSTNSNLYNIEAEKALLGSLLLNNKIFDSLNRVVLYDHFYVSHHQHIFQITSSIIEKGQVADAVTVSNLASLKSEIKDIIKFEYLIDLTSNLVSITGALGYAEIIKDLFIKRQLLELNNNIGLALHSEESPEQIISEYENGLYKLSSSNYINSDVKSFELSLKMALESAKIARKNQGGVSGVPTHLIDIDNKLGGLQRSDLIILAGRPGMGKTALATNIAHNITSKDKNMAVVIFSLEMSAEQLAGRILSQAIQVSSDKIRRGLITDSDFHKLVSAVSDLKFDRLFIDDTPSLTIGEFSTKCRRLKRKHDIKLIVVDYIQLMRSTRRIDNRVTEVGEITRGLKAVAKELDIPVIALSQLSRNVENRDDNKPILSDLRESGSIEQDADVVGFIYREAYYLQNSEPKKDDDPNKYQAWLDKLNSVKMHASLILAKNRHGPTGVIDLGFNPEFTVFGNYTKNIQK